MVLDRNRLAQVSRTVMEKIADDRICHDLAAAVDFINFVTLDLQLAVLKTRMQPIGKIFNRFNRTVRDLARELGKQVRLIIEGADTELDKSVIDELGDPLIHLIRNSMDHGIESPQARKEKGKPEMGTIVLSASHTGDYILIRHCKK
jgi:two-component system chemotaxis sensor kinase CheA